MMSQMQAENQLLQQKTQDIQAMFDDGVIKPDGQGGYQPVLDPAEKEHIKQQVSLSKRRQTLGPDKINQIQQQLSNNGDGAEDYGLE